MPTELLDRTGDYLRERAHEFGTTTGRARRVGWFDAAVSRYTASINGFDSIALTRLDILDELETVKISAGYRLDGVTLETPPSDPANLARCEPVYEEMEGWKMPTRGASDFDDLPAQAIAYIERIESLVRVPVALVGVGPERSERIVRQALWEQRSR
jgi:adenylosuccinate synthase